MIGLAIDNNKKQYLLNIILILIKSFLVCLIFIKGFEYIASIIDYASRDYNVTVRYIVWFVALSVSYILVQSTSYLIIRKKISYRKYVFDKKVILVSVIGLGMFISTAYDVISMEYFGYFIALLSLLVQLFETLKEE